VRKNRLSILKTQTTLLTRPYTTYSGLYNKPIPFTNLTLPKTSSHPNPRKYFSTTPNPSENDPKNPSNSTSEKPPSPDPKKPETPSQKNSEDSIFDQISNTFKGIGEFFSFSDPKDSKDSKSDSKNSSGTQNANNWFNENQNLAT
jgi:hypothetical protein